MLPWVTCLPLTGKSNTHLLLLNLTIRSLKYCRQLNDEAPLIVAVNTSGESVKVNLKELDPTNSEYTVILRSIRSENPETSPG